MKLSLIILTKNSASTVERVIRCIHGVSFEVVIVDSESTDYTVKIAKKYTDKVFIRPFENNFSKLRNFAVSKAAGEWIVMLDSDEIASPEMAAAIPDLCHEQNIEGFWFPRKTYISANRYLRYGFFYPDYQLKLFRNKKGYKYSGAVHEQLNIPKEKTREMDAPIFHYPTHPKYTKFSDFANMFPYIQIEAKELAKLKKSQLWYLWNGKVTFILSFIAGYFRGKGFLDGWAGFRAHILFSLSLAMGYFYAIKFKHDKI